MRRKLEGLQTHLYVASNGSKSQETDCCLIIALQIPTGKDITCSLWVEIFSFAFHKEENWAWRGEVHLPSLKVPDCVLKRMPESFAQVIQPLDSMNRIRKWN